MRLYIRISWWLLVGVFLLFGSISATIISIVINVIALFCLPMLASTKLRNFALHSIVSWLFGVAFVILSIVFIIDAKQLADLVYIGNFVPLLLSFPIYAIGRLLAGKKTALIVCVLFLVGTVISFGVAVFDVFVLSTSRAGGILTNPLVFARLSLTLGFIAAAGILFPIGRSRFIFLLAPALSVAAALMAGARGPLLATPFLVVVLIGFLVSGLQRNVFRSIVLSIIVVVALTVGFYFFVPGSGRFFGLFDLLRQLVSNGVVADRSIQIRLEFYSAGWELFLESPWLGYGWANLSNAAFTILDANNYGEMTRRYFHFHNDAINLAVAAGMFGIASWIILLAAPVVSALKSVRDCFFIARVYMAFAISLLYFLFGLTDITFGYDMPTTAYVMISAIFLGAVRKTTKPTEQVSRPAPEVLPA